MEITPGSVVVSRAGHDKGRIYAVVAISGGMAELADGRTRKSDCPKRKSVRHISYLGKLETADARSLEDHILRELLRSWR